MRKTISSIVFVSLVWTVFPGISEAAITIKSLNIGENELGMGAPDADSETEKRVNLRDCLDNVTVTITFSDDSSSSASGDLYLIAGESCKSKTTDLDPDCYVEEVLTNETKKPLRDLLKIDDAEGCKSETTGSVDIWVARLEEVNVDETRDAGETWSANWKISWDMAPPDPPQISKGGVGSQKILIKWATNDNDAGDNGEGLSSDTNEVRVVYMSSASEVGVGDSEAAGVLNENTASDSHTDTADTADTADDAFQAAGGGGAADTATEADTASSGVCPTGGFNEGDDYVRGEFDEHTEDTPSGGETNVTRLTNGTTYKLGAVALDEFNNASTISNTVCATPNPTDDFADDYTEAGGKVGKFCFVATAAFGSYDHPMVKLLRRFRDQFLAPIPGGQTVINGYYRVGPSIAAVVEGHPVLKAATKGALTLLAVSTVPLSALGPIGSLLACLVAAMSIFVVRRRLK